MTEAHPEPLIVSDFAWRQLPPNSKIPNYASLGTCTVDGHGHTQITVADTALQHKLFSGDVWSEYARPRLALDHLREDLLRTVYSFKARLDRHRPLSEDTATQIFEKYCNAYMIEHQKHVTCGSADPELNMLVKGGVIAGGCHQQVRAEKKDLQKALEYIASTVETTSCAQILRSPQTFTHYVKGIHARLVDTAARTQNFVAGDWRRENVCLPNAKWVPPQHCELESLMNSYAEWACAAHRSMDPVHFSFELHCRFVYLHPFADGNGRIARLLANLVLLEAGYPPVVLTAKEKQKFCAALEQGFWGDKREYNAMMLTLMKASMEIYLGVLPGEQGKSAAIPLAPLGGNHSFWSMDSFESQVSFQTPVSLNLGPAFGSSEGKLPSPGSVEACGLERHNSCGTLSPHRDRRLSNSSAAKASPALLQRRSGSVASMEGGWAPDWARRQCSLERQHLTLDAEGVLLDRSPPHLQLRQRHSYGSRPSPSNVLHADRVTDTSSVVSNLSSSYSFIEPPEDYPPFK